MNSQIISKERVSSHGEVLTGEREVTAMLNLVEHETNRIDSRFLEPACGNGNFLIEILGRKLAVVERRYHKSQIEFERYAVLAVTSIYGIDLLTDNVSECRARLMQVFTATYSRLFETKAKPACLASVSFILDRNIIQGDALTLMTAEEIPKPIIFSEWSPVNGSLLKRRDFSFRALLAHEDTKSLPLFSDLGKEVFVPTPVRDYPVIHFLELVDE